MLARASPTPTRRSRRICSTLLCSPSIFRRSFSAASKLPSASQAMSAGSPSSLPSQPPPAVSTSSPPRPLAAPQFLPNRTGARFPPPTPSPDHLDRGLLAIYQNRLQTHFHTTKPTKWRYMGPENTTWRHAAICIPLCTVNSVPSILFTVRSAKLRRHGGEISFPGGSMDPGDIDVYATALRETHEEIFIDPVHVTPLGVFHPMPDRTHTILIHPVLCHVQMPVDPKAMRFSDSEVGEVFAVGLKELVGMETKVERFRDGGREVRNWVVGEGKTIWGLTAWVLEEVLSIIVAPGPKRPTA